MSQTSLSAVLMQGGRLGGLGGSIVVTQDMLVLLEYKLEKSLTLM